MGIQVDILLWKKTSSVPFVALNVTDSEDIPYRVLTKTDWHALCESDRPLLLLQESAKLCAQAIELLASAMQEKSQPEAVIPLELNVQEFASFSDVIVVKRAAQSALPRQEAIARWEGNCILVRKRTLISIGFFERPLSEQSFFEFRSKLSSVFYNFGISIWLIPSAFALCKSTGNAESLVVQRNIDNMRLHKQLMNGHRGILFLLHRDFQENAQDPVGGTQLHVKDLTESLRKNFNVYVLARSGADFLFTAYLPDEVLPFTFPAPAVPPCPELRNPAYFEFFSNILDSFPIDLVHIHNCFELPLDLFYVAAERHLPLFFTVHDYYALCPTAIMLDAGGKMCFGCSPSNACGQCLEKKTKIVADERYITYWRKEWLQALSLCQMIFAPSKSAANYFSGCLPELTVPITVIPHARSLPLASYRPEPQKGMLRVAFMGNIDYHKGAEIIIELVKKGNRHFQWTLIGGTSVQKLFFLHQKNYSKTDWYTRENLPDIIASRKIDIVCFFPLCAETYCYTMSEAATCGVPCVVLDRGALPERIRLSSAGWVLPANSTAEQILSFLTKLREHPCEIKEKAEKTPLLAGKAMKEAAKAYQTYYEAYLPLSPSLPLSPNAEWVYQAAFTGGAVCIAPPGQCSDTAVRMRKAEQELAKLRHSRSYQMLELLERLLAPIMEPLLGLMGKLLSAFNVKL